jgi:AraC family transcriptional regulator
MPAAFETRHARDALLPLHRHRTPYVALVVEGDYLEFGPDGPVRCGPGSLLLHPAYHAHGNRFGRHGARVLNLDLQQGPADGRFMLRHVADLAAAREIFAGEPGSLDEVLQGSAPVPAPHAPDWQAPFVAALATGDEPVGDIARRLGVSLPHASRSVRAAYGLAPQALRRELRWRRALALLAGTRPLADVSTEAGFADQSHFTRTTRLCAGLTPAALRRHINCVQDDA